MIELVAASKAIKRNDVKEARQNTPVGNHDVDFWLHVFGSINVGNDYESTPTVAIPYKRAFAALCHVAGCTGKHGVAMIRRAMEIALADENDVDAMTALERICPAVDQVEHEIIEPMLSQLPKLPCKGKVTTSLQYEIR